MKIKLFEEFTKNSWASKEVDIIYKDPQDKYIIMLPKTHKASMTYGYKTGWCQSSIGGASGFNLWSRNALLIRFLFKGGYKMRVSVFNQTSDQKYRFDWGHQSGNHILGDYGKNPFKIKFRDENRKSTMEKEISDHINMLSESAINATLKYIDENISKVETIYTRKDEDSELSDIQIKSEKLLNSWINKNEFEIKREFQTWKIQSKNYDDMYKKWMISTGEEYKKLKNILVSIRVYIKDNGSIFCNGKLIKSKEDLEKQIEVQKLMDY